jgi:hypothetical protein
MLHVLSISHSFDRPGGSDGFVVVFGGGGGGGGFGSGSDCGGGDWTCKCLLSRHLSINDFNLFA